MRAHTRDLWAIENGRTHADCLRRRRPSSLCWTSWCSRQCSGGGQTHPSCIRRNGSRYVWMARISLGQPNRPQLSRSDWFGPSSLNRWTWYDGRTRGREDKRTRRTGRYKAREGMRRTRWSVVGGGAGKVRKLKFNGEWNLPNKSHSQKPGLWWMIYFVDHLLIIMIGHYAAMDRGGSEGGSRQEDLAELRRSSQDIDLEMLYILWSCPCA